MKYRMALFTALVAMSGCAHVLPPAAQIQHPGPGVNGPGPGVMAQMGGMGGMGGMGMGGMGMGGPGCLEGGGAGGGGGGMMAATSQIHFVGPEGAQVRWEIGGEGSFTPEPLVTPARYNFAQGSIYRLRLSDIPGYPGEVFYPTLEVGPVLPRTAAYLAHNAIPVQFTQEDFDQVLTGNFVTKVIYLPDAEYQELAIAGVETLVSTRLDPGVDPIVEADRRGSILAIVRLGNKFLEQVGGDAMGAIEGGEGMVMGGYGQGGYAQYGMPITGTPIGLPGPPHIPLGIPAGLQKHTMTNHTHRNIPGPSERIDIRARHVPGYSYPRPATNINVREWGNRGAAGGASAEDCP